MIWEKKDTELRITHIKSDLSRQKNPGALYPDI